jgi:protein STE50
VSAGILEHGISGDVLIQLDPETLKDVGVASLGQRLAILKAVYHLKIANHIAIEPEHYVPPCKSSLSLAAPPLIILI